MTRSGESLSVATEPTGRTRIYAYPWTVTEPSAASDPILVLGQAVDIALSTLAGLNLDDPVVLAETVNLLLAEFVAATAPVCTALATRAAHHPDTPLAYAMAHLRRAFGHLAQDTVDLNQVAHELLNAHTTLQDEYGDAADRGETVTVSAPARFRCSDPPRDRSNPLSGPGRSTAHAG